MSEPFLSECVAILERTPATVDAMLRGLPDAWVRTTEGPDTWCPYDVVGHFIHGEKTDWIPRLEIILKHGESVTFEPFDRFAQFRDSQGKSMEMLLDEFRTLRAGCLKRLREINLQPEQLQLTGIHPAIGKVTVRNLLACWTSHDLSHIVQIARTMARRNKQEVGPWVAHMTVLK